MAVAAGTRFGVFEVVERLGAGGMGEVYRARDTRLDRTVALKVIRASELPGHDRIERFEREARAISPLNHQHICALYDIGEQNGEAFLVMEYAPGETLANRLERGPLRIEAHRAVRHVPVETSYGAGGALGCRISRGPMMSTKP